MSGANAASEYSEGAQNKDLSGKGTQQGQKSLYETITGKKDPGSKKQASDRQTSSSASLPHISQPQGSSIKGGRGPKDTPQDPTSSMGGGSSSIYSQVVQNSLVQ